MRAIQDRKSTLIVGGLFVLAAIVFLFFIPRMNPPKPQTHSYLISPGGVSRAIVQHKRAQTQTGRYSPPYLPHHLEFESAGGAVDVYVVRFPSGSAREQVEAMTRLTEQLTAGQPPEDIVATDSGERGRIDLNWWPYGRTIYLVLVRAERESEVTMVVHYSP